MLTYGFVCTYGFKELTCVCFLTLFVVCTYGFICYAQSHNIKLNDTMKEVSRIAGLEAKPAGLLNGSGALVTLLQLLPDKHSKQHCVAIANAQLCPEANADIQTLEAGLLLRELQVTQDD